MSSRNIQYPSLVGQIKSIIMQLVMINYHQQVSREGCYILFPNLTSITQFKRVMMLFWHNEERQSLRICSTDHLQDSHLQDNYELLPNRYLNKVVTLYCLVYSSIMQLKGVMILFWNNSLSTRYPKKWIIPYHNLVIIEVILI